MKQPRGAAVAACLLFIVTLLAGCVEDAPVAGRVVAPDDPAIPRDRYQDDHAASTSAGQETARLADPCPSDPRRYEARFGPAQPPSAAMVGGGELHRAAGPRLATFDGDAGVWRALPGRPSDEPGTLAANDDWLVVVGGHEQAGQSADLFNRSTRQWQVAPDLPLGRVHHAVAVVGDEVFVMGGERFAGGPPVDTVWSWRPGQRAWTERAPLPVATSEAAAVVLDGNVILLGGRTLEDNATRSMWRFEPGRNLWNPDGGLPGPRAGAAAAIHCDWLWLVGGSNGTADMNTTFVKNLRSGAWRPGPTLALPRADLSVASFCNVLWIAGGRVNQTTTPALELIAAPGARSCIEDLRADTFSITRGGSTQQGDSSGSSGTSASRPPTVSLDPSVLMGQAPLRVTFRLDGSDPDGDNLTWKLDLSDTGRVNYTGTTLPALVQWTFWSEGIHNVTLHVSDGNHTVRSNVTLQALAAPGTLQTQRISIFGADPAACAGAPQDFVDGFLHETFRINPQSRGAVFSVALQAFPPAPDHGIIFTRANGAVSASFYSHPLDDDFQRIDGRVPTDAFEATVFSCGVPKVTSGWYRAG